MFRRTLLTLVAILIVALFAGCSDTTDTGEPEPHRTDPQQLAKAGPPGDQYIVELRRGSDARDIASQAAAAHALKVGHVYNAALDGFTFRGSAKAAEQLANRPDVVSVSADLPVDISQQLLPDGINRIDADQNATAAIDGQDTRVDADVAILDTGVDASHPDLNVTQHIDCVGGTGCSAGGTDIDGHGTHVAGTVAALDNNTGVVGVAPGARIHAIKVLEPGVYASISDVIAGIDWVIANAPEVDVINMSLGGTGCMPSFQTAIQSAVNSGIYVAVAAGNSSRDIAGNGVYGDCDDTIPAAYPEAATISAMVDADGQPGGLGTSSVYGDDDSFASFSNFAASSPSSNPVNAPGGGIDLVLPGSSILSTCVGGNYCMMSGTSMASPHAAGLAALYFAEFGDAADAADVYAARQALIDDAAAQTSSDGFATLDDPDKNLEPVGLASFSGSGSGSTTDPAPEPDPITTPELTPSSQSALDGPSQTVTYQFSLCNVGDSLGSYSNTTASGWVSSVSPTSVSDLSAGSCTTLDVSHTIPATAADGDTDQGTLTVDSGTEIATASFETTADAPSWAVTLDPTQQMGATSPGGSMTYSFNVCNNGNRTDSYALSTNSNWSSTLSTTSISDLSPGACQSVSLSHTAPSTSQDGESDSGMLTVASGNASATATYDTIVEAPIWNVSLDPSQQSGATSPGGSVTYSFDVCNNGNRTDSYAVSANSSWASTLSTTSISDLSPGACQSVSVSHAAPSTSQDGESDSGVLTIASANASATASYDTLVDAPSWDVSVDPAQQSGATSPGGSMIYTFDICNYGNRTDSYSVSATSGWASTLSTTSISDLSPGACQSVNVSHAAPSTSQDGESDSGTLTIVSANASATATYDTTVEAPSYQVSVGPDSQMAFGAPGDAVQYDFTVCNDGNRTDSFALSTTSAWSASVSPTSLTDLAAGACQSVSVTHNLPSTGQDGELDSGVLSVSSANASASATFESTIDAPTTEPEPEPEPFAVTGMSPDTVRAGNNISVKISGTGFTPGISAEFVDGRGRNPRVQSLTVVDSNTITATVSTKSGGPRGSRVFDLVLTDSTGQSVVLPGALTVTR